LVNPTILQLKAISTLSIPSGVYTVNFQMLKY